MPKQICDPFRCGKQYLEGLSYYLEGVESGSFTWVRDSTGLPDNVTVECITLEDGGKAYVVRELLAGKAPILGFDINSEDSDICYVGYERMDKNGNLTGLVEFNSAAGLRNVSLAGEDSKSDQNILTVNEDGQVVLPKENGETIRVTDMTAALTNGKITYEMHTESGSTWTCSIDYGDELQLKAGEAEIEEQIKSLSEHYQVTPIYATRTLDGSNGSEEKILVGFLLNYPEVVQRNRYYDPSSRRRTAGTQIAYLRLWATPRDPQSLWNSYGIHRAYGSHRAHGRHRTYGVYRVYRTHSAVVCVSFLYDQDTVRIGV